MQRITQAACDMPPRARSSAGGDAAGTLADGLSCFEALPDPLLVDILLRLPLLERLRAQLISKRLLALVCDPAEGLWRRVSFESARPAARAQPLQRALTQRYGRPHPQACQSLLA